MKNVGLVVVDAKRKCYRFLGFLVGPKNKVLCLRFFYRFSKSKSRNHVWEKATNEINDGARCNCRDLRRRRCRREGIELQRARQKVN